MKQKKHRYNWTYITTSLTAASAVFLQWMSLYMLLLLLLCLFAKFNFTICLDKERKQKTRKLISEQALLALCLLPHWHLNKRQRNFLILLLRSL